MSVVPLGRTAVVCSSCTGGSDGHPAGSPTRFESHLQLGETWITDVPSVPTAAMPQQVATGDRLECRSFSLVGEWCNVTYREHALLGCELVLSVEASDCPRVKTFEMLAILTGVSDCTGMPSPRWSYPRSSRLSPAPATAKTRPGISWRRKNDVIISSSSASDGSAAPVIGIDLAVRSRRPAPLTIPAVATPQRKPRRLGAIFCRRSDLLNSPVESVGRTTDGATAGWPAAATARSGSIGAPAANKNPIPRVITGYDAVTP